MKKNGEANLIEKELSEWGLNEGAPDREADGNGIAFSEIPDEMTEINQELLDRVEELEMSSQQTDDAAAITDILDDRDTLYDINNDFRKDVYAAPELDWKHADTIAEHLSRKNHIMDIIRDFERDIDNTTTLEDAMQADIRKTMEAVSIESKARIDLQARADILETQVTLADSMRNEIPVAEEDRNRISNSLFKAQTELKSVTDERSTLSETLSDAEECGIKIKKEISDLKEQASDMDNKIENMDQIRRELTSVKNERDLLDERAHEFEKRMETSSTSVEAVKSDLDASRSLTHKLRGKVEAGRTQICDLKRQSSVVNTEMSHIRMQIDKQAKINLKLEAQVKNLTKNCEVVDTRLNSAKRMLNRFNVAAIRFHQQTRDVLSRPHSRV